MIGLNWRRGAFRLWVMASVLWCVAVFSISLLENQKANESQTATVAPGCKNGASICEPWQRDWATVPSLKLKPDTVVTEQGTIMQPNGVSTWEAIIRAAPGAIALPLAVLVVGASLFWAFAGFRRDVP